jgi:hypothetical protein
MVDRDGSVGRADIVLLSGAAPLALIEVTVKVLEYGRPASDPLVIVLPGVTDACDKNFDAFGLRTPRQSQKSCTIST